MEKDLIEIDAETKEMLKQLVSCGLVAACVYYCTYLCMPLQDFGNISNLQVVPDGMAPATGYPPRGH